MTIRIHALLHNELNVLGFTESWAKAHNHRITYTRLYNSDPLPAQDSFDWLIIMGGPMSIHDDDQFKWLVAEKQFIQQSLDAGKTAIGICLGAQLIAQCLGAKVQQLDIQEIGWTAIGLTDVAKSHVLLRGLHDKNLTTFQWHSDGFECPTGALAIATSAAWHNQGYIYQSDLHRVQGSWVIGLQFHPEITKNSLKNMVSNGIDNILQAHLDYPTTTQSADTILASGDKYIDENNQILETLLDNLADNCTLANNR